MNDEPCCMFCGVSIEDAEDAALYRGALAHHRCVTHSLLAEVRRLTEERDEVRADVVAAAGELMVPIPVPGTTEARMLLANVAMRRERAVAVDAFHRCRQERDEARAALAAARVDGARGMRDKILAHARFERSRHQGDGTNEDHDFQLREASIAKANALLQLAGDVSRMDPATVVAPITEAPPHCTAPLADTEGVVDLNDVVAALLARKSVPNG